MFKYRLLIIIFFTSFISLAQVEKDPEIIEKDINIKEIDTTIIDTILLDEVILSKDKLDFQLLVVERYH